MNITPGWLFFAGGLVGLVNVSRAKTVSWLNTDGNISSEELKASQVPVTRIKRILLLILCALLVIGGALDIQRKHNWNPFNPCKTCSHADDNKAVS
jgi:hypothetical protein